MHFLDWGLLCYGTVQTHKFLPVLEEPAAFVFGVVVVGPTLYNNSENYSLNFHHHEHLRSCVMHFLFITAVWNCEL
jgi:hypothetical protein